MRGRQPLRLGKRHELWLLLRLLLRHELRLLLLLLGAEAALVER